jgi:Lon protease-like protein
MTIRVPLFPLHSVLFPGGTVQLRIFEPRYIDMVSNCLKAESCFGVAAIKEGSEAGDPAVSYKYGTLARINDWSSRGDGLLGISASGEQRFRIIDTQITASNLIEADIATLDEPETVLPDARFEPLLTLLRTGFSKVNEPLTASDPRLRDAAWVGYRISEILPLDNEAKTRLLALEDPIERLEILMRVLESLQAED